MTPNPYEPSTQAIDDRSTFERFAEWLRAPFPVLAEADGGFRWLFDSFVAFVIWIVGTIVAGFFAETTQFLEPMAYPIGLFVGWFPTGIWMHYCRVSRENGFSAVLLIAGLLIVFAVSSGWSGVLALPLGFVILMLVLPIELMLGKLILGWLPSSSVRQRTEQRCEHADWR